MEAPNEKDSEAPSDILSQDRNNEVSPSEDPKLDINNLEEKVNSRKQSVA